MLDEKDLQDISKIMDEKIAASEQRMMERITESEQRMTRYMDQTITERITESEQRMTHYMDQTITERITESEQRMTEKIAESEQRMTEKIAESEQRMTRYMGVLIENEVTPKFNLLADALAEMREMLVTPARVEKIENEQQMQKAVIRQMAGRLSRLEKAN